MKSIYDKLFDGGFITRQQHAYLCSIASEEVISVYSELRVVLYLGILLFTGGAGYLAYENIGEIGHALAMLLLLVVAIFSFRYVFKNSIPYSPTEVIVPLPYFDYVLLLAGLSVVALCTYFQIYFELIDQVINWSSLALTAMFFYLAYRFDSRTQLSLGITLLAATIGISLSPIGIIKGNFVVKDLIHPGLLLGVALVLGGFISKRKHVKAHFAFTYKNFGLLLFFFAGVSAIFLIRKELPYVFLVCSTAALVALFSWRYKYFLFFLYASISGYIALNYWLIESLSGFDGLTFILFFIPTSCMLFVVWLVVNKKHFIDNE